MNWYKKAKLIDVDYPNGMRVQCAYCKRWATTTGEENRPRDFASWKKVGNLDDEEAMQLIKTEGKLDKMGIPNISHGMCPFCSGVAKNLDRKHIPYNPDIIRQLSLQMSDA